MPVDPFVARARALIGVPFKLHGRDRDGVDCVGMVALICGKIEGIPNGYAMRNSLSARWLIELDGLAERRTDGHYGPGEILLVEAGPAQYHLGCWSGEGLIHADARLRRVVETPGPVAWPVLGVWRLSKTAA